MCSKKDADRKDEKLSDYNLESLPVDIDDELLPEIDLDSLLIPIGGDNDGES